MFNNQYSIINIQYFPLETGESKISPSGDGGNMAGIFLLGMMGSGKSHWCKQIAKKLKCGAYDLDYLIEMDEERTVAEIFAQNGEEYFRKTEAKILRWFAEKKNFCAGYRWRYTLLLR